MAVWAPPRSLAATCGIDFSFSSSPYLDVSVQAVPCTALWIYAVPARVCLAGFPHSDTSGSTGICPSPKLFAACRVFHRLLVPRHPPRALFSLASCFRPYGLLAGRIALRPPGLWSFFRHTLRMPSDVLIFLSIVSICGFQGTCINLYIGIFMPNGDGEIRTLDPLLARQVLSQLSYTPILPI